MTQLSSIGSLQGRFSSAKDCVTLRPTSRLPDYSRPFAPTCQLHTRPQAQPLPNTSSFRELSDHQRVTSKWSGPSPHSAGVAVVSTVGKHRGAGKLFNQDAFAVEQLQPLPSASATLITVCDGHGTDGHLLAKHVAQQVAAAAQEAAEAALAPPSPERSLWWDAEFYHVSNLSCPDLLAAGAAAVTVPAPAEFTPSMAQQVLEQAFGRAAQGVGFLRGVDPERSGSTAVACLVLPDSVVAVWAGDSRAVLGTAGAEGMPHTAVQLTRDHKPNVLSEMSRVLGSGGRVVRAADSKGRPMGPFRIVPDPSLGWRTTGVAVARAFGDLAFQKIGVVPTPEAAVFRRASAGAQAAGVAGAIAPAQAGAAADVWAGAAAQAAEVGARTDRGEARGEGRGTEREPRQVLILATDGLWDMLSNEEAVEVALATGSPEEAAQQLAEAARQRWAVRSGGHTCDDITVAVAFL